MNNVRINALHALAWSSLAFFCVGFSSPLRNEPACLKLVGERVERLNRDEVHFGLKVVNETGKSVFLTGVGQEKPIPYPLFLEQWRAGEGWKAVVPCMDLPPPHVIVLNPSQTIDVELVLTLPLPSTCKDRNIQLDGKFRYRLEYFESEEEARTYVRGTYSPGRQAAGAAVAVSAPFRIPPPGR